MTAKKQNLQDVVLHVGLHKTGTSFLQKQVFPRLAGVQFFDRPYTNYPYFDMDFSNEKSNLISGERYSGVPHLLRKSDRYVIARNLKRFFPNARIIIGVREKESWLRSCYKEAVLQGCFYPFTTWKEKLDPSYLRIEEYVEYLRDAFADVFLYRMEDFQTDRQHAVADICAFIGCPCPEYKDKIVNKSLDDRQLALLRFLNRFLKSEFNPRRRLPQRILRYQIYRFRK